MENHDDLTFTIIIMEKSAPADDRSLLGFIVILSLSFAAVIGIVVAA